MSELLITRGLPASGKTRWAKQLLAERRVGSIIRLNRDDLRRMMLPATYREPFFPAEELVTKVQHGPITELLRAGVDIIIDDTNMRARSVRTVAALAERADATWSVVDFLDVPLEECLRRDAARENSVGEDVIRRMYQKYLSGGRTLPVPTVDAQVTGKPYVRCAVGELPRAVMVDIDGTVACHGSRNPFDTSRYHEDTPNWDIVEAVRMEMRAGNSILFCSGRSEEFRDVTATWLEKHVMQTERLDVRWWRLFMRPTSDTRNDAVVKLELFDQHIRGQFDVRRVYDDRDRVVKAWRSIGLTVLQVSDGNF
jgi:predicted kinase